MRKVLTILAVATAITTSGWIAAKEGNQHETLTGTVKSVDTKALVLKVETTGKKVVTISVTLKTRIAHGDNAAMLRQVTPGSRVVVTTEHGKSGLEATAIELTDAPALPADLN